METDIFLDADRAAAELCKRKLSFFVKEFWDVIVPNELQWNWHMDILCDEIQASDERVFKRLPKLYDLIINVPPGTTKTKIVSILSTCWEMARMPEIRVFVGSFSDNAVGGIADEVHLVMSSDKYQKYFPETIIRKDRDALFNFKTTRNGEFYAFTIGGTITSKHADILKVDDPINPRLAVSEIGIKNANDFFDQTLPTRKVDKKVTPTYLIMQRLAANDPTGHLLERDRSGIRHVCLPGTISKEVKPAEYKMFYDANGLLDSNRLSQSSLDKLKIELGSYGYAGQIDQVPSPAGGLIWKQWFVPIADEIFPIIGDMTSVGTDWDLAFTKKDMNSGSAYVTSGRINEKMFIDNLGVVYYEFPELVNFMKENISPHYIEAKGPGQSSKQTLVRNKIPAIEVKVTSDKIARAKMASPYAEAGMIYIRASLLGFLYHDARQGILKFPRGSHSDLSDVLAQSIHRIFKGGVITGTSKEASVLDSVTSD